MSFTLLDWTAILGYLAIMLLFGFYFRSRSGRSVDDYFVSGRNVNWWLAGTSMVATTFGADTPLVVTGLVYTQGVSGNWMWWGFLLSGMMTVFLFARLWRRSGLLTDVQFAEMRYSGKPAAFLRGFRAVYLGLLMNCVILGWVTKAMTSIVSTTLSGTPMLANIGRFMGTHLGSVWAGDDGAALAICVLFLIPFTGLYVSLGGLWGVLWTDLFQFVLKMGIVIAVAYYAVSAAGGMSAMLSKLAAARTVNGASDPLTMFPDFSRGISGQALWTIPVAAFLVHIGLQWWAFWYPGAEPGGGGYIAQRIFSARDEKNGVLSVLWFNVAHYAVRPWPWVLTALSALVLYPGLKHPESGYMMVLNHHLPHSLRGIAIAGFLAAFMSTVATQLNWGASYLVSDFYRRFIKRQASEKHYVMISRLSTVFLVIAAAWVSVHLSSIGSGWQVVLEVGAGTGTVYLLRWYWWRINAWSEISAMASSLVSTIIINAWHPFSGNTSIVFAQTAVATTIATTVVWVLVTFLTQPESEAILLSFYRKVRPDVLGWKRIAKLAPDIPETHDLGQNLYAWVLGCAMIYLCLFGTGKLIFRQPVLGSALLIGSGICAVLLYREISYRWASSEQDTSSEVQAEATAQR